MNGEPVGRAARWRSIIARSLPPLLVIGIVAVTLGIVRQWAYVTTYRLYLDQRADKATASTATQRFDLEGARVVPQIVMRDDQVAFQMNVGRNSTIRAELRPEGPASYEIRLRQQGVDRVVAAGTVMTAMSIIYPFPTGTGIVELVSRGTLTWSDLRVQRNLRVAPLMWTLGALVGILVLWAHRHRPIVATAGDRRRRRSMALGITTACLSLALTTLALEAGLRAVGTQLSSGIAAARHDLGEATQDPRWEDTSRYGRRLRRNVSATNEWRHGDIVRMGFIPPGVSEGRLHRYSFRTDSEGFRNPVTRDELEVAALGDSFTDALTMAREASWPAQLEDRIGRPVQNYGTAGFGPPQERLVLHDYVLGHRPRVVVLAFFAGNDLRDADVFERERAGQADGPTDHAVLGWPIKSVVTRADTWFLMNALQAATANLTAPMFAQANAAPPRTTTSIAETSPYFDRGMYRVTVNGRLLQWAFMPPYLNMLTFSERDLSAHRGWTVTRESAIDMQRASRAIGAEFVVMFLPFKSQVYLPLLERTFTRAQLTEAFRYSLRDLVPQPDVERMSGNRLALNGMMRRFCEEAGIPFLDTTDALQARVESGENMYFPDESHLNEAGEAAVAETLARFLWERGLVRPRAN